jgi:hypothetical protein
MHQSITGRDMRIRMGTEEASAVLDDREMLEAGKELELWARARRVALLSRVLHVYLLASIAILAGVAYGVFGHDAASWIPVAAGFATVPTAWTVGRMATKATTSLPEVEHRRLEIGRLEATGMAVTTYSWLVVAAGVVCMVAGLS